MIQELRVFSLNRGDVDPHRVPAKFSVAITFLDTGERAFHEFIKSFLGRNTKYAHEMQWKQNGTPPNGVSADVGSGL